VPAEERHRPAVERDYDREGIRVHWEPGLCIHVANCIRGLPRVFDPNARPWVDASAADADEIAGVVATCPTGALSFTRTDGAQGEAPAVPTTIQPRLNGPLFVRGDLEVIGTDGKVIRKATRLALCRCGHSANKPFCDLSHRAVGFRSS
jgi:uncharacterized Fe-S cluster protein YjdI